MCAASKPMHRTERPPLAKRPCRGAASGRRRAALRGAAKLRARVARSRVPVARGVAAVEHRQQLEHDGVAKRHRARRLECDAAERRRRAARRAARRLAAEPRRRGGRAGDVRPRGLHGDALLAVAVAVGYEQRNLGRAPALGGGRALAADDLGRQPAARGAARDRHRQLALAAALAADREGRSPWREDSRQRRVDGGTRVEGGRVQRRAAAAAAL
ncbi:MAG: hypothetical protein J3K34DRAFT_445843 [Monoraphidium minutum]|nr:MAG: hypothetical protein J3K34DRAFT_445843 [Monoraphidium minutum]